MGVLPLLGRTILPADGAPEAEPVAVLGYRDQLVEVIENIVQILRPSAPPRPHRRQQQVFAEQMPTEVGLKRQDRSGFDDARSERVRDRHVAAPRGLDETRDAVRGVGAQLQRIAQAVVESAEDDIDRLEAIERLDEDTTVADRQIAILDEGQSEIPGEIGVLEVRFVVRARRQQHDVRVIALMRRQRRQRIAIRSKKRGEPLVLRRRVSP